MKFTYPVIMALFLLFTACKNSKQEETPAGNGIAKKDSVGISQEFFPVASFIRNEIEYVDSLPIGIKKYHTKGKKTDSAYIKSEEFHKLASEFLGTEISDTAFKKSFTESSFLDRSTNNATFFYKASNPSTSIQRVDVVTAKGDVYDEVKSIYMEKMVNEGENTIRKKLFWKPKRNFQIISLAGDQSNGAEIVKVVWDNREE